MRKRNQTRSNNTVPGFLSKTYKILENPEYADIISWNEDGKAFKVKKPNEFAEKVLPKYFKTNNFASFVRQLNMYDFHKLRHDSEENEWRHRLFRRGHPNLLCEIKRKINETQIQDAVVSQKEQKKITNDTQYLLKEMVSLKQKQESLEKACSVLIAQNTQILGENKLLWGELNKKKDKSQKKVEKLFSLFFTYIGPNKFQDLAFMNSQKHKEYLKQEEMSLEDNDDEQPSALRGLGHSRNQFGSTSKQQGQQQGRWDVSEITDSLNMYPFNGGAGNGSNNNNNANNGNNNNLSNSFNGAQLNASTFLASSNNNNQIVDEPNPAQKIMDGLLKNLQKKSEGQIVMKTLNDAQSQQKQPLSNQFNNVVDSFHDQNNFLLSKLQYFMSTQGGTSDLSSVDLNKQINQSTGGGVGNNGTDGLMMKRNTVLQGTQLKKMTSNPFNPNQIGQSDMDLASVLDASTNGNINRDENSVLVSKPIKKFKKDDETAVSVRYNNNASVNPAAAVNSINNGLGLEDFLNNNINQSRDMFNTFNDMDVNNRTSLDFSKFMQFGNNNGFSTLALPNSTTNQNPIQSVQIGQGDKVARTGEQANKLNDSVNGFVLSNKNNNKVIIGDGVVAGAATDASMRMTTNPHQMNSEWDDFSKFISEQKIEDQSQLNASIQPSVKIDQFLSNKDIVSGVGASLNGSML